MASITVILDTHKTCPFCDAGLPNVYTDHRGDEDYGELVVYSYVECWNCEARGPEASTPVKAVGKWNNRNEKTKSN